MIEHAHLSAIRQIMPPNCRYFIAGGCLLPGYYTDIDIYFYRKSDYVLAFEALTQYVSYSTDNADTYSIPYGTEDPWGNPTFTLQCISRTFGTPLEVLSDFDLNKSRQALLLDGTLYQHPTFHADLYFEPDNFRYNTLSRLIKYMYHKHQPLDLPKFHANISHLLSKPLDTTYGHYYVLNEDIDCTLPNLLKKAIQDSLVFFSYLHPSIESLPEDQRLAIYQELIIPYTNFTVAPSMSDEFNIMVYANRMLDTPNATLPQSTVDKYPEYLI